MPTLIQFGAGNIGRGFIGPVFSAAGWEVIFVDVAKPMVEAFNSRRSYQVIEVDTGVERPVAVGPVRAIDGRDVTAVGAAVASADLVATAVGLGAIPHLGKPLAEGLRQRQRPLDILVCENGMSAPADLRRAILAALPEADRPAADARLGTVRTSIGRMIPPPAAGGDALDIRVEPYCHLPVERPAFRGPVPVGEHLDPVDDFDLIVRQKLYLHNMTHACLAYAGHLRGLETIPDCMEHADLVAGIRAAGAEVSEALARAHGGGDLARQATVRRDCLALVDDLCIRYRNRALGDPVGRVARDPLRKLAADDRLIGSARLCVAQGVRFPVLAAHIGLACRYTPAVDEPGRDRFLALQARGWPALLTEIANISPEDPIMSAVATAHQVAHFKAALPARRAAAAAAMRAAGIILRDDEAAAVEIADFGLGRFAEYGLAIHVYVNTDRCCAKELVMTPGQICPEHRHPPVDGEPGKEETFRVRQGEVFLFLPGHKGDGAEKAKALHLLPADKHAAHTMYKCVHLKPGDQYTLKPNTPHWFAAGPQGAIVSEFSTKSRDEADVFTDPAIIRLPPE